MQTFILLSVRRIITACLVITGSLSLIPLPVLAQNCGGLGNPVNNTSSGTQFLLVFMRNELAGYDMTNARYQDIYLASLGESATVTITCRAFPGWSKVFNLAPYASASYRLSTDPMIKYPGRDAIVEVPENIDSTVFKVVATAPITCYGMNNKQYTADAFLALPYSSATPEYRVMAYYNSNALAVSSDPQVSEFAVASFDNNNSVTIIPAAVTSSGNPKLTPMTFQLDSGECVQIEGDPNDVLGDMTGSIVRSTKPVVVYSGSSRTEVPTGFTFSQDGNINTSRDHLCEAMPPLSTWGTSFIAKNFGRSDGDYLRVLSSVDNTTIKINGKNWGSPMKANTFRDTLIASSPIALDNIYTVESDIDKPILVGMLAHTSDPVSQLGDPFLAIVPPLQQTYNDFTFFLSNDIANYMQNQHFLIIATELSGAGNITIDPGTKNITPPAGAYTTIPFGLNGGKQYAVTTVNLDTGIHRIVSKNPLPANGFTILAYGWGPVISYGYTAGQLLVPHSGIIPLKNPTHSVAPNPGNSIDQPPSIIVRNILNEKIFFDSARISYTQNDQNNTVSLKKDIASQTKTIESAEEKILELTTLQPVEDVVAGNIKIWYHTALWTTLMPVDFPFVIKPQAQAAVNTQTAGQVILENYPNPASGRTTIHFTLPQRAHASLKLYDALGRMVKVLTEGEINSGDQHIQLPTNNLIPGEYTLELISPELGINMHRKMMILE